jgi:nicotinamide-nucleotide amidase
MATGCEIANLAAELVGLLQEKGLTMATAESCTGGAVSAAVTSVAGCSSVMLGGVVAYSNSVKTGVLGVDEAVLAGHGAVSEPVVRQMVAGVAALLGADCAVATSGIAGPGGGTPEKPVGTVWIAAKAGEMVGVKLLRTGNAGREYNIETSVSEALSLLLGMLKGGEL